MSQIITVRYEDGCVKADHDWWMVGKYPHQDDHNRRVQFFMDAPRQVHKSVFDSWKGSGFDYMQALYDDAQTLLDTILVRWSGGKLRADHNSWYADRSPTDSEYNAAIDFFAAAPRRVSKHLFDWHSPTERWLKRLHENAKTFINPDSATKSDPIIAVNWRDGNIHASHDWWSMNHSHFNDEHNRRVDFFKAGPRRVHKSVFDSRPRLFRNNPVDYTKALYDDAQTILNPDNPIITMTSNGSQVQSEDGTVWSIFNIGNSDHNMRAEWLQAAPRRVHKSVFDSAPSGISNMEYCLRLYNDAQAILKAEGVQDMAQPATVRGEVIEVKVSTSRARLDSSYDWWPISFDVSGPDKLRQHQSRLDFLAAAPRQVEKAVFDNAVGISNYEYVLNVYESAQRVLAASKPIDLVTITAKSTTRNTTSVKLIDPAGNDWFVAAEAGLPLGSFTIPVALWRLREQMIERHPTSQAQLEWVKLVNESLTVVSATEQEPELDVTWKLDSDGDLCMVYDGETQVYSSRESDCEPFFNYFVKNQPQPRDEGERDEWHDMIDNNDYKPLYSQLATQSLGDLTDVSFKLYDGRVSMFRDGARIHNFQHMNKEQENELTQRENAMIPQLFFNVLRTSNSSHIERALYTFVTGKQQA